MKSNPCGRLRPGDEVTWTDDDGERRYGVFIEMSTPHLAEIVEIDTGATFEVPICDLAISA
ncbi:uncharacterized protein PFL1_04131 [Pseudozyma flocculosa PF-1]|uniref:Hypervirulence associated protein TUDOR domain-containing protein n=1 Tax=Pseudozyma flocculosa PF-1 TaxID=1277687 RepID=A0A061H762_9BASI|nr:uncharacterized protein PFL1_04131 [Pseudozyma flocculosa PF-1]EPQ28304.1 hypothetical protein PFL1_04131 [Pseudozyma flocculosa PF-1]